MEEFSEKKQGESKREAWLIGARVASVAFALGIVQRDAIYYLVTGCVRKEFFSSLLVFSVVIYMIWAKRAYLRNLPYKQALLPGAVVLSVGGLALHLGKISSTIMLEEISFFIMVLGLLLLLGGRKYFRRLLVPIGLLMLMTSIAEELIEFYSAPFQHASAWIAATFLSVAGMPVHKQGLYIELPHIMLEIAKGCSGWNYVMTMIVLSIPVIYLTRMKKISKVATFISAVLIGVILNGARIASIGIWSKYCGNGDIHGPFHMVFSATCILIVATFLGYLSRRGSLNEVPEGHGYIIEEVKGIKTNKWGWVFALGVLLCMYTLSSFWLPREVALAEDLSKLPYVIGDWTGQDVSKIEGLPQTPPADNELRRIYRRPDGALVGIYVGYYRIQKQEREIVNRTYRRLHLKSDIARWQEGDQEGFKVNRYCSRASARVTCNYFWYHIEDKVAVSRYETKLRSMINALSERSASGAVVVGTTQYKSSSKVAPTETEVLRLLSRFAEVLKAHLKQNEVEASGERNGG